MEEGALKGIFIITDIDLTCSALFSAIKGMEFEWASLYDVGEIEKNVETLWRIFLNGIVKR
jgi:hypothetical protein